MSAGWHLYEIQDDAPAFVVAQGFEDAIGRWRTWHNEKNPDNPLGDHEMPQGVNFLTDFVPVVLPCGTPGGVEFPEQVATRLAAAENVAIEAALLFDAIDHGACAEGAAVDLSDASRLRAASEVWWAEGGFEGADLDRWAADIETELLPGVPPRKADAPSPGGE